MKYFILGLLLAFTNANSQNWTEGTPLPQGTVVRNHPITFSIGDNAYYLTGFSETTGAIYSDFYKYDSKTEEWETMELFPGGPRGFAYGVSYNGKGYAGFGVSNIYYNDLWEFDPETEQWTELNSCPCEARKHPAMVASNGKIFVGLGDNDSGNLKDWWEYDIETNNWKELPDLPGLPRHHPYYFAIGNNVYAGLGHGTALDEYNKRIYKSWFKWDTENDEWTRMKDFPGEGRVAGTQFSHGGYGYILSGQGDDHLNFEEGEFYQYDPIEDSWLMLESHPGESSRWAPGSFVIRDTVYFTSGRGGFGNNTYEFADLLKFTLPTSTASVGIEENLVDVYPNPAREFINLNIDLNKVDKIELSDIKGNLLFSKKNRIDRIEVSNYPEGTYFLTIEGESLSQTKKFIIKR